MQEAVAQPFRFRGREVTVKGVDLQPAERVGSDAPGLVDRELTRR
jgi:hypothetical protein